MDFMQANAELSGGRHLARPLECRVSGDKGEIE